MPSLADQHGLILRSQALAAGLTDRAIRWRLDTGRWQHIAPALYATFSGAPTADQRLIAATLFGGEGAQITGAAALRFHGCRYAPDESRIHLLVPAPRRRTSCRFIVVIRTSRPDQRSRRRGVIEVCSVARAAADAARLGYPRRDVRALLMEVVQRRLTTITRLAHETEHGPKRGSTLLREVLAELRDGVRSAPEAELREIVGRSAILPKVRWNPKLYLPDETRLPTPDGWIEDAGIALEADSQQFHSTPDGWRQTLARHNPYSAAGILVLHFTPQEIRAEPARVLALIERAYEERRGWRGGVVGRE